MFDIYTLVEAIWIIIPAYAANGLTPLIGFKKKLHPIDGGRNFIDGRRVLGDGKTWEGFFLGTAVAVIIAIVEMLAYPYLPWNISPVRLDIIPMSPFTGFLIGMGAMLGDVGGSFIKRRLGLERGCFAPLLDQDDFVLGSFLLLSLYIPVKIKWIILLLIITPVFHIIANIAGYKLGIKKQPW